MKFFPQKYRTAVFSGIAVLASAAMIHYAMGEIDTAVLVSTAETDTSKKIIVLDSGHGECVLSIVI